jgi:Zn-dependent metalloprotease
MLRAIAQNGSPAQQAMAWASISESEQVRGQRLLLGAFAAVAAVPAGSRRRTVYDAANGYVLPGRLVRGETGPRSKDAAVNEAFDGSGATYALFARVFERNSMDGRGMRLDSSVHYGQGYDNAFWNGRQMVYGDGDGKIFGRFTGSLDVIGHELAHGVTQFSAGLEYRDQSGALNESMSDVFGSLVKQYKLRQETEKASWLIGEGLFLPGVTARAIRSMRAPGTAYDDPVLGKDPQPGHMKDYVETTDDNGGVHLNSGIPNRAFYETATRLGGKAWERAGRIWYRALTTRFRANSDFRDAARATHAVAGELYGARSPEQLAVRAGWAAVGLKVT